MELDEKVNSAKIAMWYKDTPIQLDVLKAFEGKVTKECWRYLIGKACLSEKNKRSHNERASDIYDQLGKDLGYVHPSMKRLVNYANAIDRIQRGFPNIATDILNGKTRLNLQNTIILSKKEFSEISIIFERLCHEKTPIFAIFDEQQSLRVKPKRGRGRPRKKAYEPSRISVKDNPTYNPDAQVNALSYTIPSWVSMVEKTFAHSDSSQMSLSARNRLNEELNRLIGTAESVLALLTEVK